MPVRVVHSLFFLGLCLCFFTACITKQVRPLIPDQASGEYVTTLSVEDTWRAIMRFSDKYHYHVDDLDSDKGIMVISKGDTYNTGYGMAVFRYTLILMGLEKGTRIVVEGGFYANENLEVTSLSQDEIKKRNEYLLLSELKKYFETELNHGSGANTKS